MTAVIEVHNLTKPYRDVAAIDTASFSVEQYTIYGYSAETAQARRR